MLLLLRLPFKNFLQAEKSFSTDFQSDAQPLALTRKKLLRTMRAVFGKHLDLGNANFKSKNLRACPAAEFMIHIAKKRRSTRKPYAG
jgi:hypothetical protein